MSICLLAIETSTDACSVAIVCNEHIYESFEVIPKQHTRNLLFMLDALLAQLEVSFSQIDAIAFGCGPGSFTGLRIAASVVQGLAIARDIPVIPISTLQALAQGAYRQLGTQNVFSSLDARMGEVYAGFYQFSEDTHLMMPYVGNESPQTADFLINPAQITFPSGFKWCGAGNGCLAFLSIFQQHKEFYWDEKAHDIYPSAHDVVALALPRFSKKEWVSAEEAVPIYLRDSIINIR